MHHWIDEFGLEGFVCFCVGCVECAECVECMVSKGVGEMSFL
jgi:hypothetical protein